MKKEIKAQAKAFLETLGDYSTAKAYRRSPEGQSALAQLPVEVQSAVRELIEARRGFRRVNGKIEHTKEALVAHIARLTEKKAEMKARLPLIDAKLAEYEDELSARFGETNE